MFVVVINYLTLKLSLYMYTVIRCIIIGRVTGFMHRQEKVQDGLFFICRRQEITIRPKFLVKDGEMKTHGFTVFGLSV